MKLLIITPIYPPQIGGPATYTIELLKRLGEGYDIDVLTFSENKNVKYADNIHIVSTKGNAIIRQFSFLVSCVKYISKSQTVLILEPLVVGLWSTVISTILRKKTIIKFVGDPCWEESRRQGKSQDSLDEFYSKRTHLKDYRFWLTRFALRLVNIVISPSNYLADFLKNNYALNRNKIVVIPNSVDSSGIKINKTSNSIIYSGRLVPWKNVDFVIRSLSRIKTKFRLVIVGDGSEKNKLIDLVKSLGMDRKVIFMGDLPVNESIKEIAKSEILVLMSDYEGMSHVILESMAQHTVVVASNIKANRETIENGINGLLINLGDSDEFLNCINRLFANKSQLNKLSDRAYLTYQEKYSWNVNLKKLRLLLG